MNEYPKEISKEDRFDWFPCEPSRLLGALAGMKPPKKLTYLMVLLRIYECGGACPDSVDALALRVGFNKRIVTDALSELCKEGRLYFADGGIHNPKADDVIADSIALRERRKVAAVNAGKQSAKKRKKKQEEEATNRSTNDQPFSTQIQIQEQDSLFSIENRVPASVSKPVEASPEPAKPSRPRKASDWPSDYREWFWTNYPRRTEKKAAMAKLDAIEKAGQVPWAQFSAGVLRHAKHVAGTEERYIKHPTTWLNRGCWDDEASTTANGGTANGQDRNVRNGPRLGFAGIAASIRARNAEGAANPQRFADACDHEPSDGRRPAEPPLGSLDRDGQAADVAAAAHRR